MKFQNNHKRNHNWRTLLSWFSLVVLAALVGVLVWLVVFHDQPTLVENNSTPRRLESKTDSRKIFSSSTFEFSLSKDWRERQDLRREDQVYVYVQEQDRLVKRYLKIYINNPDTEYQVPYIVPVSLDKNKFSSIGNTSEHCSGQPVGQATIGERQVFLEGVKFLCDVDATDFRVAAGLINQSLQIPVDNQSGDSLIIEYQDLTFEPDSQIFESMLETFRLKDKP